MNIVLVTGGAGFLGRHLVKGLLHKYNDIEVRVLARHESDIAQTIVDCNNCRLKTIVGDIRDADTLRYALKNVDTVIHLAAMKHVDFCESNPSEAITINTFAATSLLKLFNGNIFIGISTDKAVEASGCYGATKLLLEKLVIEQSQRDTNRKYMVVRSGNIFGSSGSVIERWKQEIKKNNRITATNLEMTRFFINVDTLVNFIINTIEQGESGNIYIPSQKVATLQDLATSMIEFYGDENTRTEVIGLRKGEKMHEKLFSISEENVITDLKSECSEYGDKLSVEEIKAWLAD